MNPERPHGASPVAGIVLAAGLSQRMGGCKLALPFRGKTLLAHVVRAATAATLSPVIVVLGDDAPQLNGRIDFGRATVVVNPESRTGRASSLKKGLQQVSPDRAGIMVLLGDQPLVTAGLIDSLLSAFGRHPDHWVAPVYHGRRGNPVIIPRRWFQDLLSLTDDQGPRRLLSSPGLRLHLIPVDVPAVVIDVDTPEDYQALKSGE
jgi:molybdenum cofactor cytidylyltransferase